MYWLLDDASADSQYIERRLHRAWIRIPAAHSSALVTAWLCLMRVGGRDLDEFDPMCVRAPLGNYHGRALDAGRNASLANDFDHNIYIYMGYGAEEGIGDWLQPISDALLQPGHRYGWRSVLVLAELIGSGLGLGA